MTPIFASSKKRIDAFLKKFLREQKTLRLMNPWGKDALAKLELFATSGKTVRGSLVLLSYNLFSAGLPTDALRAAAGLELLHSGLLIHDDIMDRDDTRRGMPSVEFHYRKKVKEKGSRNPGHSGLSLAITAGDLAFFLGCELLSRVSSPVRETILQAVSSELAAVCVAQLQDVAGSYVPQKLTESDIMTLYRYKTARYTFSLPMTIGARLSGADSRSIGLLEKLGESVGMLFQIRDDELGLFGDTNVTGKPVGGDAHEEKQTLLRYFLEKEFHVLPDDTQGLTRLYEKSGARKSLTLLKSKYAREATGSIDDLPLDNRHKKTLLELTDFCMVRTK